jgi:uncharacterized protein YqjF (DUF2071 family)
LPVDLFQVGHRPYPPPRRRAWSIFMRWHDLLFLHWPVGAARVRPYVPPGLEVEEFGGSAWLGVVPFTMTGVRHRLGPPVPGLSAFPELNVRTYVRAERGGRPAVWFFSLDASSRVAVTVARKAFGLAYMNAVMRVRREGGVVRYESRRTGPHSALAFGETTAREAEFRGAYRPIGDAAAPARGSLEEFLTNRYCLYAWRRGRLMRAEIHHGPWPLAPAEAEVETNTMGAPLGIDLAALERESGPPLRHYAAGMDVVVWMPEAV